MSRTIPMIDMLFLLAESRDAPQHVAGVMVFENPKPQAGWTVTDLVQKYRQATPIAPFNVIPKFSVKSRPRWVKAGNMDMSYHVQHVALPAPGSEQQLNELVQTWHNVVFDRSQPLFQLYVIEGLADNRFAIYAKFHHAIVDGASAIARLLASVNVDPEAPIGLPFFAVDVGAGASEESLPASMVKQLIGSSSQYLQACKVAIDLSTGIWRKTLARVLAGAPAIGSLPFEAPMTLFNKPVRQGRSFAHVTLPLAALKAVGKAAGGTLNDVALAVVDTAVHRYLDERKSPLGKRLLALVPVSLREAGDVEATTKISAVVIALGEAGVDLSSRLGQIMQSMKDAKAEVGSMSKAAAGGYSVAIYAAAQGLGAFGITRPLANMIVSNVPGSSKEMYLGGSRMLGVYPVSVISVGMGLNVTLVSHAGRLHVGVTSQTQSLPDPQRLADLLAEATGDLLHAGTAKPVAEVVGAPVKRPARKARASGKTVARKQAAARAATARKRSPRGAKSALVAEAA